MRFVSRAAVVGALALLISPTSAMAQMLDVPFSTYCPPDAQAACFGAARVMGLDPNGDGFLAVRSGPGSNYSKIGEVYNGDRVETFGGQGNWYAISFGPNNRLGWAHGNWLGDHIP